MTPMKAILPLALMMVTASPAASLEFDVPAGWISKTPSSSMRLADFSLPKVPGDPEDGSVTVYYFGRQGGSIQANIDRWIGQLTQPDGRASKDVAKTTTVETKGGLKVTLLDVSGTYVAEVTPGSTERFNKPGFRQLASVVDTPDGPHFVKVVGPAATVAKWEASVMAFLKSLRWE